MPSLVVRSLDESIIHAPKERAVKHHRSSEAEHKAILAGVMMKPQRKNFAEALASIPAVGMEPEFQRVNDDNSEANVFD